MITLSRKYTFYARHRLHSPQLDDARNLAVYGKCNNPMGHGHNYGIEITVTGPLNPETGMIVAPETLDAAVRTALEARWDHQDINDTLGENFITTGENLAQRIYADVAAALPAGLRLCRVKLHETRKNTFVCFGEAERANGLPDRHPAFL